MVMVTADDSSLQVELQESWQLNLSKVQCPTKHIIGHIGMGFYGSNNPTNSVEALKEDRS